MFGFKSPRDFKLLEHATIVSLALFASNLINYVFQVYMGRALGPENYGIFGFFLSIFYIFSVPTETLRVFVTKYVSSFKKSAAAWFLRETFKKILYFGIIFGLVALFLRSFISFTSFMLLFGLVVVLNFTFSLFKFALGGLERFGKMGIVSVATSATKFLFGVFFVSLGLGVAGALSGIALGFLFGTFFGMFFLKDFIFSRAVKKKENYANYFSYGFLALFLLTLFYNLDVVLVKFFFPSTQAGYYVASSTLARSILFLSMPVVVSMFPKICKIKKKSCSRKIFLYAAIYVSLIGLLGVVIFSFFSPQIVNLFYGKAYIQAKNLLGMFSLGMLFFIFSNLFVHHNLANENTSFLPYLILGVILEVTGIFFFHNSLLEVVGVFTFSNFIVFLMLLGNEVFG